MNWIYSCLILLPLLISSSAQNQFGYQDPSFSMEDMLASLPRVVSVPAGSGSCLPTQELASGGQISGGFGRANQDDPRCNGTLRKQASPRSGTLGAGSALSAGQGREKCWVRMKKYTMVRQIDKYIDRYTDINYQSLGEVHLKRFKLYWYCKSSLIMLRYSYMIFHIVIHFISWCRISIQCLLSFYANRHSMAFY